MRRVPCFAFLLCLCVAPASFAAAPATMSYQGVLTDAAGALVADGSYDFTFRLYGAASGGAPLWTETQGGVVVSNGGFAVTLGAVTPLALAFDVPYWLGVSVNGAAELEPRTALASSPYSLALRLPFVGVQSQLSGPLVTLRNTAGPTALAVSPGIEIGGASGPGVLTVWGPASPARGLFVDADADGFGNPRLDLAGGGSTFALNTAQSGNAAAVLPAGSVSADETSNEPGIAQGRLPSVVFTVTSTTTMETVVSTTLTTPSSGYIVVDAVAQHGLSTSGPDNLLALQVDETPGGTPDTDHYVLSGYSGGAPAGSQFFGVHARRTYFKPPGTWTFVLEVRKESAGGTSWLYNPAITAMFVPTSYGSVTTAVTGVERAGFEQAAVIATGDPRPHGPAAVPAGTRWLVDLRELEVRAAGEREQLERTERELAAARRRVSGAAGPARETGSRRQDRAGQDR